MTVSGARMRSAVLAGPRRVVVDDVPRPEPGPGQVRVRLEGSGVCGSNLPPWEGRDWFKYPFAPGSPGHEGWGVVDAVGDGVVAVERGARVAFLSDRAFSEFDLTAAETIVKLPAALDGQPFPGEALGCAVNIFRRAQVEPGQTVAIIGIGFLGAVLTRLCSNAGARVIALTRRPWALEVAKDFGADERIVLDDHARVIARVRALTGDALCERVIEAVGRQWPLELAGELTRVRGRLVIAGYHQDGPRQVNVGLWNWRGLDVINAHERDPAVYLEGIRIAAELVASGEVDPRPLYTHRYRLDELGRALADLSTRPDGFLKGLVMP